MGTRLNMTVIRTTIPVLLIIGTVVFEHSLLRVFRTKELTEILF